MGPGVTPGTLSVQRPRFVLVYGLSQRYRISGGNLAKFHSGALDRVRERALKLFFYLDLFVYLLDEIIPRT